MDHLIEVDGKTYPNNGTDINFYAALMRTIDEHAPKEEGARVELVITTQNGGVVSRNSLCAHYKKKGQDLIARAQYFIAPYGEIDKGAAGE